MSSIDIASIRREYAREELDETHVAGDPLVQFHQWFAEAVNAKLPEPTAMTLATSDATGAPHARIVLLKDADEQGFAFYTNYGSAKGQHLEANPRASLLFFWPELERQVRIDGRVIKTSREESQAYFDSRPVGSRIGAWASRQSDVLTTRGELEHRMHELTQQFADGEVPLPEWWGGYRVIPSRYEFWQGRPNRLHDRIVYERAGDTWRTLRLSP
jgi:pyridoxamine 5'-phosphate oxidase